ncbi:MAG: methylmalonyl-CoA mutase family protein [Candidatus Marinimicrobia bacterium]|nr:methylmalonyl-CoA mutase family protein [Candidatus Neomarinimicrobiota bacterium]
MSTSKTKKDWLGTTYEAFCQKGGERPEAFKTMSGVKIDPLYTPEDLNNNYNDEIGYPGEYPYTRGVYPTMYRGRYWTMRQYAGFGDAKQSNERYKYLLKHGQTGLSVAFDLPTQIGYDSDNPICDGEIGKVGVAIDSLEDMEVLFDQIPLDKVSTSMTINSPASILLAMYMVVAEKQGVSSDKLTGTIQNDILKEYIARGTYIFPPKASMRLVTDTFEYCSKNIPKWNTISISGYHIREAGSTAAQEIGFTLADGIAYTEAALKAGMDIDAFAGRLSFFFNAHNNLFEEVAKFRAARRLWAKIMAERFGAKKAKSLMLRFHTQTGGSTLTAQQPDNNIVRVAIQALSAVLGGTQSLHTNSKEEALALPSEESVRIALRTQQVIAYESGVTQTIDPLAGSYFIEALTDKLEAEAQAYIEKIDELGGMSTAIEQGYVQREIQREAYRTQKEIENNECVIVGLNKFSIKENAPKNLLRVDRRIQQEQIKRIKDLKSRRDNNEVKKSLEKLKIACQGNDSLMPYIVASVRVYATLGEICNVMRDIFGEYKENIVV